MRNLKEVHGIDLVRRVAKEKLQDKKSLKRVWSDDMCCWGFFSDQPTEGDVFMIIGCSNPGDMFVSGKHWPYLFSTPDCKLIEENYENKTYMITNLKQFELNGAIMYGLEMLGSSPAIICQMMAQHNTLFKIAWEYLNKY